MWRIWLVFDPRRALVAQAVFLATLAFMIHFVLMSTDRFNWFEGMAVSEAESLTKVVSVLPTSPNRVI